MTAPPTKMDKTIARHRALVSLFYECATSTEINPATASALEQVITEIHAQGRDAIEALPWYGLIMTGAVINALEEQEVALLMIGVGVNAHAIDGLNLSDEIKPMITEIGHWIILEKRERYGELPAA